MIDKTQLQALAGESPEFVLEILQDFKEDALQSFEELRNFISELRFGEAAGILHTLAGSSGTLGLSQLYEKIRSMEGECERELVCASSVDALRGLLESSVEQAQEFLR